MACEELTLTPRFGVLCKTVIHFCITLLDPGLKEVVHVSPSHKTGNISLIRRVNVVYLVVRFDVGKFSRPNSGAYERKVDALSELARMHESISSLRTNTYVEVSAIDCDAFTVGRCGVLCSVYEVCEISSPRISSVRRGQLMAQCDALATMVRVIEASPSGAMVAACDATVEAVSYEVERNA